LRQFFTLFLPPVAQRRIECHSDPSRFGVMRRAICLRRPPGALRFMALSRLAPSLHFQLGSDAELVLAIAYAGAELIRDLLTP